jgi:hypothetical protein
VYVSKLTAVFSFSPDSQADSLYAWRHKPASVFEGMDDLVPSARADHAAVSLRLVNPVDNITYDAYFAYGGRNHYAISIDATPLANTWIYSMSHFGWLEVDQPSPPDPRMAHSAVMVPLVGDHGEDDDHTDDVPRQTTDVIVFGGVQVRAC